MKRLKVLHVLLSRGFAGTERSTVESCNYQCLTHDVVLVIRKGQSKSNGAGVLNKLESGVRVIEVPARFTTFRKLQALIDQETPDVLHAHLRRATRLIAKARSSAVKVSTLHIGVNGKQFLEMDGLIAISPWQLQSLPNSYSGEVQWIRNSLEPHPKPAPEQLRLRRQALGANDDTFVIGGVGRLCESKGWDILIKAFKRAELKQSKLILIGDGRQKAYLQKLANGANIEFLGFQQNVKDFYPAFDVFVCPSREEPMGRVILESLDAGTPVIATEADGPADILSEFPGTLTLVPIEDEAALAQALIAAQCNPHKIWVDLSMHFGEKVTEEMLNFYQRLLNMRNQSQPG